MIRRHGAVFLLALVGFAPAQQATGAIAGKVVDQQDQPIPGVTITLTSGTLRLSTPTSISGEYRFDRLRPGAYRVEARLTGFVTEMAPRVTVVAGRTSEWDALMRVGSDIDPFLELRSSVQRLTGNSPVDCGQHRLRGPSRPITATELQQSLTCAATARTQGRAFWTFKQEQGIDSVIIDGILGARNGAMYRFSYDSHPCGGPGCGGAFDTEPCERPIVVNNRGSEPEFGCGR